MNKGKIVFNTLRETSLHLLEWLQSANPNAATAELVTLFRTCLRQTVDRLEASAQRSTCKHCGQPVARYPDTIWLRTDERERRGCRAASLATTTGWDDALDERYRATPSTRFERIATPYRRADSL